MTTMPATAPPHLEVLCVDDEPNVLAAISLHLRRKFVVLTAASGSAGLDVLLAHPGVAVIISDMRMPAMDGVAFLAEARRLSPHAVRILLTGQADLDSAIAVVNEAQIFRFLTKPCVPAALLRAVESAADQHRLITAERVLLEQTLRGSIEALSDVLALTNPVSFGRATRIKRLVVALAAHLDLEPRWALEVAAMVSHLGWIVLPPETAERAYLGEPLSDTDQRMLARVPEVTERLLAHIPRLELVREILAGHGLLARDPDVPEVSTAPEIERAVRVLSLASSYDALESQGCAAAAALAALQGHPRRHGAELLGALARVIGAEDDSGDVRDLPVSALDEGMVFLADVRTVGGTLLVARGFELTAAVVERLRNLRPGSVSEPIRVSIARITP